MSGTAVHVISLDRRCSRDSWSPYDGHAVRLELARRETENTSYGQDEDKRSQYNHLADRSHAQGSLHTGLSPGRIVSEKADVSFEPNR